MQYNRDSFLSGLAVGRTLWRPIPEPEIVDYGGWTASAEFAVFDAGAMLVEYEGSARTPFTKSRYGWAICCVITGFYNIGYYWTGPLLISSNQNAALYDNGLGPERREFWTVEYDGITWYGNHSTWNSPSWGGGSQVPETDFPVLDASDRTLFPNGASVMLAVLAIAGVRRTK